MSEKLFIGICNTQHEVPADFFWSFIHIRNPYPIQAYRARHPWDVIRNNQIIDKFLKSDCTILAKMDIDQTYPYDYFMRFVPLAVEYGAAGPLIFDRWEENSFVPLAFDRLEGVFPVPADISGLSGVTEIYYPHTNLFYRRDVFEKIPPPWYEAYLSKDGLSRANHVDFALIDKIHKAGFKCMIDFDCVVGHEYNTFVNRKFYDIWNKGTR